MDKRCPLNNDDYPQTWCHLAVMRLKALRNAGRELTEAEEAMLPGCPYAVNHQLANYCFFKMMKDSIPDKPLSDIEIAHFLNLSVDTVKKTEKVALVKIRESEDFVEIRKVHGTDKIVDDGPDDSEYEIRT